MELSNDDIVLIHEVMIDIDEYDGWTPEFYEEIVEFRSRVYGEAKRRKLWWAR